MENKIYDVIIIGAGVSGLRSAELLLKTNKNLNVLVLEARDRVGGRTDSVQYNHHNYDIGGQWVSTKQKNVMSLIDEIGLETYPQNTDGTKIMEFNSEMRKTFNGFVPPIGIMQSIKLQFIIWKWESMMKQVPDFGTPLNVNEVYSQAREWDKISVGHWITENVSAEDTKSLICLAIQSIFCDHPDNVSMLYMLMVLKSVGSFERAFSTNNGGAQEYKIYNGAYQLSMFLEKRVNELSQEPRTIRFSHAVSEISGYDSYPVKVTCDNGEQFTCKYLISTIPPPLCKDITYTPPLPKEREALVNTMKMGKVIKFLVFYENNLWNNLSNATRFSGEVLSFGNGVNFIYDATLSNGSNPCIVGFFTGENALRWGKKKSEQRKNEVIDFLFKNLGNGQDSRYLNPTQYIECDWSKEEYSKGGYGGVVPPNTSFLDYKDSLFKFIGRMHFAGTETSNKWVGYIDGALSSAERVANEVLYQINPCNTVKVKIGPAGNANDRLVDKNSNENQGILNAILSNNYKHVINLSLIFMVSFKILKLIKEK